MRRFMLVLVMVMAVAGPVLAHEEQACDTAAYLEAINNDVLGVSGDAAAAIQDDVGSFPALFRIMVKVITTRNTLENSWEAVAKCSGDVIMLHYESIALLNAWEDIYLLQLFSYMEPGLQETILEGAGLIFERVAEKQARVIEVGGGRGAGRRPRPYGRVI